MPEVSFRPSAWEGLGGAVLLQNARWFTRIRWVVVATFAAFGAASLWLPGMLRAAGIVPQPLWPWVLGAGLALINAGVMAWLHRLPAGSARLDAAANLWFQIAADLLLVTVLVHLVGPADTVVPFAYLFHIVLACIFFAPRESLIVTLLSALLFLSLVTLEIAGVLPSRSVLQNAWSHPPDPRAFLMTALPTVFVWMVVWYLVSTMSNAVRQRDRELDEANRRLLEADEQRNLQVLRVTHDLKAPFTGIESNIEVLRSTHWEELSEAVRQTIDRIEARGATLRARIGDILMLGDLRSGGVTTTVEPVDLRALLAAVIEELQALAARRGVTVDLAAEAGEVLADPRQLRILCLNVITNAVTYSAQGGRVEIAGRVGRTPGIRVTDHGIGISERALPHIFEDYYRAKEAAHVNPQSTGLGLAIVRQAALNLGLTLVVNSKEGEGTTVEVLFPPEGRGSNGKNQAHR